MKTEKIFEKRKGKLSCLTTISCKNITLMGGSALKGVKGCVHRQAQIEEGKAEYD